MPKMDFEMSDTSPKGLGRGYKALIIAAIILLVGGGGIFAYMRSNDATKPVNNAPQTQTNDATKSTATTPNEATKPDAASEASSSQTQATSLPAASVAQPGPVNITIHFAFDSPIILDGEDTKIKDFVAKIKGATGDITIDGYTDNLGTHEYGVLLSGQRATTIATLLKELGLGNQITVTKNSLAEANPVGDNSNAQGRAQNRRAEVKFIPNK